MDLTKCIVSLIMAAGKNVWQQEVFKVNHSNPNGFLQSCLHTSAEKNMKQIAGASQSTHSRQSEEVVILQEEELCIGGGRYKAAPQNVRCRPFL